MPPLSAIRASNAAFSPSYLPTAIFVGGTSGIGQGTVEAFAHHTKGNARIFIVGRNKKAGESITSGFPKPTLPGAKHEFVECDVSLMKNVQKTTRELLERHGVDKVNFLVMSQGFATMEGRNETEEGLDKKLAVHYYSRFKFIEGLLPALLKAKEDGEDAKVLAVFAAGKGGNIDRDDLGLKKTYSLKNAALQGPTYNDLMIEEYAARYPSLTLGHAYPGIVRSNLGNAKDSPLWMKAVSRLTIGLLYPFTVSQRECGEYMLHGMLDTMKSPGAWRVTGTGSDLGKTSYYGSEEDRKALWEHSVEVTNVEA